MTNNMQGAPIDDAIHIKDRDAVAMVCECFKSIHVISHTHTLILTKASETIVLKFPIPIVITDHPFISNMYIIITTHKNP